MKPPDRIASERCRLLPPPVLLEKIQTLVAVDIADTQAVGKVAVLVVWRNGMERPRLCRIGRIEIGITVLAFRDAHEFRLAVAGEIGKRRRFVVGVLEDLVTGPVAVLALRILEPGGVLPRKADDQDVLPAVLVEVERPGKEIVRVLVLLAEKTLEARYGDGRHRSQLQLERR